MDVFGVGPVEILMVGFVSFLILGPARMVEVARTLGKFVQEIRRTTSDLANVISIEEESTPTTNMGKRTVIGESGVDSDNDREK
tara:strand:+ start:288 stop:539 length:252 start_codon:yes stop_codon:yes gene_type:complete